MQEERQASRERILEAATFVFAMKGFDGARVDEIAKTAGVNKALIYYYFESKQQILAVLFRSVVDETTTLIGSAMKTFVEGMDESGIDRFLETVLDFLEERQNILRVIMMESMKRGSVNDMIFMLIDELLHNMVESMKSSGMSVENEAAVMVTEFFTGIMPLLNFVVYHEAWMEKFRIDEPKLRAMFKKVFLGTHMAYTIQLENEALRKESEV